MDKTDSIIDAEVKDYEMSKGTIGIFERIGFIVQLSQMIEYNLLNILAGHKYFELTKDLPSIYGLEDVNYAADQSNNVLNNNKKTGMKKILDKALEDKIFTKEFVDLLNEIRVRRNYYVHHFFKDDLGKNITISNPESFYDKLGEDICKFKQVNDALLEIDQDYREYAKTF